MRCAFKKHGVASVCQSRLKEKYPRCFSEKRDCLQRCGKQMSKEQNAY
nr:MAG TPA: hypothetical protein [Caudoviricetes sp.]